MEDLLTYLSHRAWDLGVGVLATHDAGSHLPSSYIDDERLIFLNLNYKPSKYLPWQFAHEIGHFVAHESYENYMYNTNSGCRVKNEAQANKIAEKLLKRYCEVTDCDYRTIPRPDNLE